MIDPMFLALTLKLQDAERAAPASDRAHSLEVLFATDDMLNYLGKRIDKMRDTYDEVNDD